MLALMTVLVSLACTNLDQVAHASVIGSATGSDAATHERATYELTPEPAHYQPSFEAPPDCDGKALEPGGLEKSAGVDALPFLTIDVAPILPFLSPTQHVGAPVAWLADTLASSLFPRGPPVSIR